jgi:hypothetical protein
MSETIGDESGTSTEGAGAQAPGANAGATTFIGVDLHKCTVSLAAVNGAGEPVDRLRVDTKCVNRIEQWLAALPGPTHMGVESVGFAEWFIDRYRQNVDRIDIEQLSTVAPKGQASGRR